MVRAGDDRITIVLDLLIDEHAVILEGYLTRVQRLDIMAQRGRISVPGAAIL